MSDLDRFLPAPRLHQIDHIDVGASRSATWSYLRRMDFAQSPIVRALFSLRTLPQRLAGASAGSASMRFDDLSSGGKGFRVLAEHPGESITLGTIGKVWQPEIDFADVDVARFAEFDEPGWIKVAWELRCEPRGETVSRVTVDLRVCATDEESWRRFTQYFALIGPFSHFIRLHLLDLAQRELGSPSAAEARQALAGDDMLLDAVSEATDGVTLAASPEAIWPWLVQMGCRRAGWYSWDVLDNASVPSAKHIVEKFQGLRVGDIIPATPKGKDGFEVLALDPPRALVLGGLYDADEGRQLKFASARPTSFWQVTWAFALEPLDAATTRLHVRARSAVGPKQFSGPARVFIIGLVHHFMQTAQLRHLKERVEGTTPAGIEERARAVWML